MLTVVSYVGNQQIELLSQHVCNHHQAGILATSMLTAEKAGKSCAITDKALHTISESSEKTFEETMKKQTIPEADDMKFVDMTHMVFQKHEEKQLPESKFCIYKGIVANLMSWGRNDSVGKLCGVMAGDGRTVSDVIISKDFKKCIESELAINRWEDLAIKPMGIVVWVKEPQHSVDSFVTLLHELKSPFTTLMLVIMCGGKDPAVWDISISKEGVVTCCQCDGVKAQSGKKKDEKYRVVDFDVLGHTTTSSMSSTVAAMLKKSLKQRFSEKMSPSSSLHAETSNLSEHLTPADGFCFWHAILGSLDFERWIAVPRKDSGYATNSRIVKQEESMARALMTEAMGKAIENGVDPNVIEEIKDTGCVCVEHIPWVSKALQLNIRCTISDEACLGVCVCVRVCVSCWLYTFSFSNCFEI